MKIIREDTTRDELPPVDLYAGVLYGVVSAAMYNEYPRYEGVRRFGDLHDRCDANEFYQEVDELLGLQIDEYPQAYFDLANEATDRVELMFGWVKPPVPEINIQWNEMVYMLMTCKDDMLMTCKDAFIESLASQFTCTEAETVYGAFVAAGLSDEAEAFMFAHAEQDEDTDDHTIVTGVDGFEVWTYNAPEEAK